MGGAAIGRGARLLGAYAAQYLRTRTAYRADFWVDAVALLGEPLAQLGFLWALFSSADAVGTWGAPAVYFLYGFSLLPVAMFDLVSVNLWRFASNTLRRGRFDLMLLRPVHPVFQVLCESFRPHALVRVPVGIAVMAWAGGEIGVAWTPGRLAAAGVMVVSAGVLLLSLFLLATAVSFWGEDRFGIGAPVYNLMAFGRYPLDIFHPFLRFLLCWILPFAFVAYYPGAGLMAVPGWEPVAPALFWMTPAVSALVFLVALAAWDRGIRRYRSTGS